MTCGNPSARRSHFTSSRVTVPTQSPSTTHHGRTIYGPKLDARVTSALWAHNLLRLMFEFSGCDPHCLGKPRDYWTENTVLLPRQDGDLISAVYSGSFSRTTCIEGFRFGARVHFSQHILLSPGMGITFLQLLVQQTWNKILSRLFVFIKIVPC